MVPMSKSTMNLLSTAAGLISAFATVLGSTGVINKEFAGTVVVVGTAVLGYLVQKPDAIPENK